MSKKNQQPAAEVPAAEKTPAKPKATKKTGGLAAAAVTEIFKDVQPTGPFAKATIAAVLELARHIDGGAAPEAASKED